MDGSTLDLKGVVCPMTWMQTRMRLAAMSPGDSLEVIVDKGRPAAELPRSAKAEGHRVRSVRLEESVVRFVVERGGLARPNRPEPPTEVPATTAKAASGPLRASFAAKADSVGRALRRYESMADLVADADNPTPLVRLSRICPPEIGLFVKLEWMNPFGSIKDRTAKYLLEGMERRGVLAGNELVEPSSGNTGIALVALANLLGVHTSVTIPDVVPEEKRTLLRLLGATVWPTPDDMCPMIHPKDGAIALAHAIAEKPGYVMPNQYENEDNVRAHYETTGPEIWKQTEGKVRVFVAGYGTCGTITGIGRFLKEKDPSIRVVAIEPRQNHRIPGLKNLTESKRPGILDPAVVDETLTIGDELAYRTAIQLAREESVLAGPSTGAIVAGALQVAERFPGPIVAISPDSAFKYVTYFQEWVGRDGIPPAEG